MLFNSFIFLASFAGLAFVYYAIPHGVRWMLLLVTSYGFYATFQPGDAVLLLGLTVIAYGAGLAIGAVADQSDRSTRRVLLLASAAAILGPLLFVKYPRLNAAVAAGLSFYTFSCVSYVADVYARRIEPERHFGHFALYVAFFPKLLMGPIERAGTFLAQMRRPAVFSGSGVTRGLQLILWGLFKKVVIADRLAPFVDTAYGRATFAPPADLLLATYFFAFQLYCDFSGYSDMAIGAAKVLGFDLVVNFRRPYLSTSVHEFWARRWHVSLTSWFRDYVYIPLGGSRVSRLRWSVNIMAVFLLSGVWHGANWTFLVWGGLNGLYYVVSLLTRGARDSVAATLHLPARVQAVLRGLLTFHLILITWVFFRASSVSDAVTIVLRVLASAWRLPALVAARATEGVHLVSLLLIALLICVEALDEKRSVWVRLDARPMYVRWAAYYALMVALIVLGLWNSQEFVYRQF